MRTTIDLPDELYRTLKTRAAIKGVTLRELIQGLIEQGLRQPEASTEDIDPDEYPLPVAIAKTSGPVPVITSKYLHELDVADYRKKLG